MKELLPQIENWTKHEKVFVIATVIKTWGSSPRPVGSSLIVNEAEEIAGSVSGGCIEGAVIKKAMEIIKTGESQRLAFGVSDEIAWEVGLSCGGKLQLWVEKFMVFNGNQDEQEVWRKLHHCLTNNEGCVLLTKMERANAHHILVLPDGSHVGKPDSQELIHEGLRAYRERKHQTIEVGPIYYFVSVFPRKSQLLIIGAAHITHDLVRLGNMYNFETIVIDPRGIFAERAQFRDPPDKLLVKWPAEVLENYVLDQHTYAVLLSHDPKIDDQALHILLKSDIGYIGALGSRRTHDKRVARLKEAGLSATETARIHAPVGVDINAKSPKEIALSIMGEVIKIKNEYL